MCPFDIYMIHQSDPILFTRFGLKLLGLSLAESWWAETPSRWCYPSSHRRWEATEDARCVPCRFWALNYGSMRPLQHRWSNHAKSFGRPIILQIYCNIFRNVVSVESHELLMQWMCSCLERKLVPTSLACSKLWMRHLSCDLSAIFLHFPSLYSTFCAPNFVAASRSVFPSSFCIFFAFVTF